MATKNFEKRNEILRYSYILFSESDYDKVPLSDIAKMSGINKSLLQHYYPQKRNIVNNLLEDMLSISFQFMERTSFSDDDIFVKISDYTSLFFTAVESNRRLKHFVMNTISNTELLEIWIDIVFRWLKQLKEDSDHKLSSLKLKTALWFSMTGAMKLLVHKDDLGIDVLYICEMHLSTFMRILYFEQARIDAVIAHTREALENYDLSPFYDFCIDNIDWFTL